MESFYTVIALLTAGITLITGLIELSIGLNKDGEKVNLVFGIMCLCMFIFFVVPPVGFILHDKAPYNLTIQVKRIFNFSFSALFPWFVLMYTGFKKKFLAYIINGLVLLTYITMCFTKTDSEKPVWVIMVLICLGLNLVFGFYTGFFQIKRGSKKDGLWFIAAMGFFGICYLLSAINQLGNNYFGRLFGTKLFFPINLYSLGFITIMSVRLITNVFEKYRLEKRLRNNDLYWNSLIQNMQLLIVELDATGKIKYMNSYASEALGCDSPNELIGKNWFDTFTPRHEVATRKSLFKQVMDEGKLIHHFIGHITLKNEKELIVNWTNTFIHDERLNISGTLSIGLNTTDQEKAFKELQQLRAEVEQESIDTVAGNIKEESEYGIIGKSPAILYAVQKAKQVAVTNATVLLEGETGVGKELFANLIHQYGRRSNKPFIKINCAALPPELIESELFGHEKGSFTGALQSRKGKFELADKGTIFLDEIGELPLALQPKLLRVLQSGEMQRIGGQETIKVDVRIISATNKQLLQEIKDGYFREDLYYRLNVFPVTIPPLRNRKEDVSLLIKYYIQQFSEHHNKPVQTISKADMTRLMEYNWPGNIRELINLIERSVISSQGDVLKLDWPIRIAENIVISLSIEEVERTHIIKVLNDCNWKINGDDGAAIKLGLHPNTLRSRLKRLNISRAPSNA